MRYERRREVKTDREANRETRETKMMDTGWGWGVELVAMCLPGLTLSVYFDMGPEQVDRGEPA